MRGLDTSILIGRVSARLSADAADVELHVTTIDRMTMIFQPVLKDRARCAAVVQNDITIVLHFARLLIKQLIFKHHT